MPALLQHSFWCWKHKLPGILQLLSLLSGYSYSETDADAVNYNVHLTNSHTNKLLRYDLSGPNGQCQIELALDEDDQDIVLITTTASDVLQERILFLAQLQGVLRTLEIDFT